METAIPACINNTTLRETIIAMFLLSKCIKKVLSSSIYENFVP